MRDDFATRRARQQALRDQYRVPSSGVYHAVIVLVLAVLVAAVWSVAKANPGLAACPPEPSPHVVKLPDGTETIYAAATYDPAVKYLILHPWPSRLHCDGFEGST